MPGLIGKKIGMTSMYSADGKNLPCTVISTGPCVVTQVKTMKTDGYEAVQLGYGEKKEKRTTKSLKGHFNKSGGSLLRTLVEFKGFKQEVKAGDVLNISDVFEEGDFVDVVGTSKGKGFQGVVKRHGFAGVGQATHGQHNRLRAPGSIGAASDPARVFKGMKMAGQMGNERVTVQNLKVLKILADENLVVISGAIPGAKGSTVFIKN